MIAHYDDLVKTVKDQRFDLITLKGLGEKICSECKGLGYVMVDSYELVGVHGGSMPDRCPQCGDRSWETFVRRQEEHLTVLLATYGVLPAVVQAVIHTHRQLLLGSATWAVVSGPSISELAVQVDLTPINMDPSTEEKP
jgi:hypothetical protein